MLAVSVLHERCIIETRRKGCTDRCPLCRARSIKIEVNDAGKLSQKHNSAKKKTSDTSGGRVPLPARCQMCRDPAIDRCAHCQQPLCVDCFALSCPVKVHNEAAEEKSCRAWICETPLSPRCKEYTAQTQLSTSLSCPQRTTMQIRVAR